MLINDELIKSFNIKNKTFVNDWKHWRKNITSYNWSEFVLLNSDRYINNAQSKLARVKLSDLDEPNFNYNLLYALSTSTIINIILCFKSNPLLISVLSRCRCLLSDEIYIVATKYLNNYTKTHGTNLKNKQLWAELHNLVGYRTLPYPGFDPESEAKRLAEGGTSTIPDLVFESAARILLSSCSPAGKYESLRDYIKSQTWSTSGSSSFGKVTGSYNGEVFSYKARKNDLQHIFTLDELMFILENWDGIQINRASVKEETGKLRLFVAGDTISYLYAAWLSHIASTYWKQLPFNWKDQSLKDTLTELKTLKALLYLRYSVPFDFAEFDHQPTLYQVTILIRLFLSLAGVPPADKFINSYFTAYIVTELSKYLIEGGLPSGNFFTSFVGNLFNMVCQIIICAVLDHVPEYIKCRGDDSLLIFNTSSEAAQFLVAADALGIGMGKGKFSVQYQQSEFLRVWHTIDASGGYIARSIVGLSQRKPWSSDPHETFSLILSQLEANKNCMLRGGHDYSSLITRIFNKQYYRSDVLFGVLGTGLPVLKTKYDIKYRKPDYVMPLLEEKKDSLANQYPTIKQILPLNIAKYNMDHFVSTLVLPYVPGIYKDLKQAARFSVKVAKTTKLDSEKKVVMETIPFSAYFDKNDIMTRYQNVNDQVRYAVNKISFSQACKLLDPGLFSLIRNLEFKNYTRQAALWKLSGVYPIPNSFVVPSILRYSVGVWLFSVARYNAFKCNNRVRMSLFVDNALKLLITDEMFIYLTSLTST